MFCGSETADAYFKGRRGMICGACVRLAGQAQAVPGGTLCALCGRPIGGQAGLLRRRIVSAVLVRGSSTLCSECLPVLLEAAAEEVT
jgi:hypothetical protein